MRVFPGTPSHAGQRGQRGEVDIGSDDRCGFFGPLADWFQWPREKPVQ
jgi:hypothetical protein